MSIESERIKDLTNKYLLGTITEQEQIELDNWYNEDDDETLSWKNEEFDVAKERLFSKIENNLSNGDYRPKIKYMWTRYAAAAVLFISLAVTAFYLKRQHEVIYAEQINVAPGISAGAIQLADGSTIVLDDAHQGELFSQEGVNIYYRDGVLIYSANHDHMNNNLSYHTIRTAGGNKLEVRLEDGTSVWLNSASALQIPVHFTSSERVVHLTGEAYFEVAKNKLKPFKVLAKDTEVRVLGTHFNVQAYLDSDGVKTSLVEGLVEVSYKGKTKLVKPGQHLLTSNLLDPLPTDVDVYQDVAWKEGFFEFDNTPLKDIMLQLGRWYAVDIDIDEQVKDVKLGGRISKNMNLGKILQILEKNDLNFRMKNNVLYVSKPSNIQ
ncbi:MAG: FecR domain-containing protein [Sphingobacterium sp.]|jgi:ferric-dicitrate binding protein FerR (iron transport regulator)|nr:FecR domain-containing protein [Sphingobacterium sp.]